MRKRISLAEYVKKKNGVPLGAKRSFRNMLYRSFGAKSFAKFWYYWNPIWSFYLTKFVMRASLVFLPKWICVLVTFIVSGLMHDLAISILYQEIYILFTPWFGLMGLVVVLTEKFNISYAAHPLPLRVLANSFLIGSSFNIVYLPLV